METPFITALHNLNRRNFLTGTTATFLSCAALPLLGSAAQAQTPKRGGTARFGIRGGYSSDTLDPAKIVDSFPYLMGCALRNFLTEITPDGKLVGELAESWEPTADIKSWRFRLRQGVEFHNGKSLTAADAVASISHHIGPDSKSSARSYLTSIDTVSADGKDVVVFTLNKPNADLPTILSDLRLPIMPATEGGKPDLSGVGTGGYILDEFTPGVQMTAKRNPNYWKSGRAHFDRIELVVINDTTARLSAFRSGTTDIMQRCDPKTIALLAKDPKVRIIEVPSPGHDTAPLLTTTAPFDNNDVRLAVKYALNREAIVKTIMNGHGIIGNDQPIGPTYKYYAKDIPQRPYDPDRAKFHLKKAGLSSLQVDLHAAPAAFADAVDTAVVVKQYAQKAGISVNVVSEPTDSYFTSVWKKVPWCMSASLGRVIEALQFGTAYVSGGTSNESLWGNARFDMLQGEASATIDEAKRREIYREMQMIVHEEGGTVVLGFPNTLDAHSSKIAHEAKTSNLYELDGMRATERWWFA